MTKTQTLKSREVYSLANNINRLNKFKINIFLCKTRMITIIKAKLKKSDNQTNIDINKVAANITKSGIIIQKLINVKCQKSTCFFMDPRTFWLLHFLHYTQLY